MIGYRPVERWWWRDVRGGIGRLGKNVWMILNLNWELQTLLTILIISFCNYFIHMYIFVLMLAAQRLSGSYKLIKRDSIQ